MSEEAAKPTLKTQRVRHAAILLGIAAVMAFSLAIMGRVWWCEAGDLVPWSFNVMSRHNSQHLLDPYTLSHIQHGLGLYLLLVAVFGSKLTPLLRITVIAVIEAAWEIFENTDMIIGRYREATISLDYYGDSIFNSLADYAACLSGVWLAMRLSRWSAIVLFVSLELVSVWWIRDSLMLNILMLFWPLETVRQWQISG